jgi:radical SAM protein with 4Fe4S-binding SPASM domain
MHELLAGRVYVWQLQLGAAMGNLGDRRHEQIAPEDLLWLVPEIAGLIRKGGANLQVADNVGYYGPYEETIRSKRRTPVPCWIGCYAGCRHVGIEADGGVKGCLSIQSNRQTEGNVQVDALADIWHRDGAFSYNRSFKLDDLTGFCRTCEHAPVCRGGCLSMRTCEGGGENPFCYHRVATLAERRSRRKRPRYVPMVVAPAALLAMFGLGCGGNVEVDERSTQGTGGGAQDAGLQDTAASDRVAPDVIAEAGPPVTDHYGIPTPDAEPPVVDPYGVVDAGPDVPNVDYYGIMPDAEVDAEPPIVDPYGVADAEADVVEPPYDDVYGEPPP